MSRTIGLNCVHCRPTPRPAHTEYSLEYHRALLRRFAAENPAVADSAGRITDPQTLRSFYDAWDYDFLWVTHDGFINWSKAGRCTDMGHAEYAADGSDLRQPAECPFKDTSEVWKFDPIREYGLTDFDELVAGYETDFLRRQAAYPNQVCTGGYYKTAISGAIQAFGWEMLLTAAADEAKFGCVLERFGAYSLHHARAWAKTSIEVYIQHDDIVWTTGPFMRPDFYRNALFPIYRELWKPLKAAGKKVLFCSDGKFDMFMDDIAGCGADGFIFEPCNEFEGVVKKFGGVLCMVGSKVDCRTMAFSKWPQVRGEIDATLELAGGLPGFMFAVGNHIPPNVPDEICLKYMEHLRAHWRLDAQTRLSY